MSPPETTAHVADSNGFNPAACARVSGERPGNPPPPSNPRVQPSGSDHFRNPLGGSSHALEVALWTLPLAQGFRCVWGPSGRLVGKGVRATPCLYPPPPTTHPPQLCISACTGSGKTAAYLLPILHLLTADPYGVYADRAFPLAEDTSAPHPIWPAGDHTGCDWAHHDGHHFIGGGGDCRILPPPKGANKVDGVAWSGCGPGRLPQLPHRRG